jgi:hypothetical protein
LPGAVALQAASAASASPDSNLYVAKPDIVSTVRPAVTRVQPETIPAQPRARKKPPPLPAGAWFEGSSAVVYGRAIVITGDVQVSQCAG